jgi:hypothetical protein
VTVPASYDGVTMNVEPGLLNTAADGIQDAAQGVVALNTINKTVNELHLGWDGASAAEAKDFASSGSMTQTPDTTPLPAGSSGTFDMSSTAITEINWTGIPGS